MKGTRNGWCCRKCIGVLCDRTRNEWMLKVTQGFEMNEGKDAVVSHVLGLEMNGS
jgi:hypothetical protein